MKRIAIRLPILLFVLIFFLPELASSESWRIFGTVYTRDGEVYKGRIRWDKNEVCWDDILDATKSYYRQTSGSEGKKRRVSVLGLDITWYEKGDGGKGKASSGIKFGHIRSIHRLSSGKAEVRLKSGERIKFIGSGTDIGNAVRKIVIDDPEEGREELRWRDIDRVEFNPEGRHYYEDLDRRDEYRLYGVVKTEKGDVFEGIITWDMDEVLTSDILDGKERKRDREIPFRKIKAIERSSRRSAKVVLANGKKIKLSGTNDVNNQNRGILVDDPRFGRVEIEWDDFERVEFRNREGRHRLSEYDGFDGGRLLWGRVYTEDGERYTGRIIWDDDEEYSWERLDGKYKDIELDVEFSQIKSIEKNSRRGATVTLRNGNRFKLTGSNDVNEDNKGIFVEDEDGELDLIEWDELERVEFWEH